MTYTINETHDPNLRSWVESANDPNTDFPIQNLPFCWFFNNDDSEHNFRTGAIIGDWVLDIAECVYEDLFGRKGSADYIEVMVFTNSLSLNHEVRTTGKNA